MQSFLFWALSWLYLDQATAALSYDPVFPAEDHQIKAFIKTGQGDIKSLSSFNSQRSRAGHADQNVHAGTRRFFNQFATHYGQRLRRNRSSPTAGRIAWRHGIPESAGSTTGFRKIV